MGHMVKLIEEMDSKSLRNKIIVWLSKFARGIREILSFAHT